MDYEQDDVFRCVLNLGQSVPLTIEDEAIRVEMIRRLAGSRHTVELEIRLRVKQNFEACADNSIMHALARAQAKGVIPKMQPLAVWLEAAGARSALQEILRFDLAVEAARAIDPSSHILLTPARSQTAPDPKTV